MKPKIKGAPNAWSRSVKIEILLSCERAHSDKFIHTGESVKLGLVWQTEAFECRKNSFSQIAIQTNQITWGRKIFCLRLFLRFQTTRHIPSKFSVCQTLAARRTFSRIFSFLRPKNFTNVQIRICCRSGRPIQYTNMKRACIRGK